MSDHGMKVCGVVCRGGDLVGGIAFSQVGVICVVVCDVCVRWFGLVGVGVKEIVFLFGR